MWVKNFVETSFVYGGPCFTEKLISKNKAILAGRLFKFKMPWTIIVHEALQLSSRSIDFYFYDTISL